MGKLCLLNNQTVLLNTSHLPACVAESFFPVICTTSDISSELFIIRADLSWTGPAKNQIKINQSTITDSASWKYWRQSVWIIELLQFARNRWPFPIWKISQRSILFGSRQSRQQMESSRFSITQLTFAGQNKTRSNSWRWINMPFRILWILRQLNSISSLSIYVSISRSIHPSHNDFIQWITVDNNTATRQVRIPEYSEK